jgi:hypothetical protein
MPTKAELEAELAALKAKLAATQTTQPPDAVPTTMDGGVGGGAPAPTGGETGLDETRVPPPPALSPVRDTPPTDLELRIAERIYSDIGFRYHQTIMLFRLIYSLCGLFLGLACIIGGVALFFGGITGATKWTAKILASSSEISDAAPGAVLFIVGLFIVIATRFTARAISSFIPISRRF